MGILESTRPHSPESQESRLRRTSRGGIQYTTKQMVREAPKRGKIQVLRRQHPSRQRDNPIEEPGLCERVCREPEQLYASQCWLIKESFNKSIMAREFSGTGVTRLCACLDLATLFGIARRSCTIALASSMPTQHMPSTRDIRRFI